MSVGVERRRETLQYKFQQQKGKNINRRSLLEISLPQSAAELKSFLRHLDEVLLKKAHEWARQSYKAIVEQLDELIAGQRGKELCVEHLRGAWYQTCLGTVKVKRRQYREGGGRYRYLLDELMGMSRYWHVTAGVQRLVSELATAMPYRRSAEVLCKVSAIDLPHQTIWRLIAKVADPYLKKAEQEEAWFEETGEIPEGEGRKVTRLLVEADGVMLSLQREKERKAEVKLGIAYEGWAKVGKDRYRTVNKTAFAAIDSGDDFWAGMSLKLQRRYDLSRIGDTIVGGDGARWIKEGASYMNGRFQLDRYHLHRELCVALGNDKETRGKVWRSIEHGEIETGLQILADAKRQVRGERAQRLAHAHGYLQENRLGLEDYRLRLGEEGKGLRRTGAMEGNVDKLVVRRMKNQGMSWTLRGIRRLLCVRFMVLEGKLKGWLERGEGREASFIIPRKKIRRIVNRLSIQEPDGWLKAELPALRGPHASRPWARVLKALSEVPA
jgi:hypothetical protein